MPCRECKEIVSTAARTCPHCGASDPARRQARTAIGCASILAFIAIMIAIGSTGNNNSTSSNRSHLDLAPAAQPQTTRYYGQPHGDSTLWSVASDGGGRLTCERIGTIGVFHESEGRGVFTITQYAGIQLVQIVAVYDDFS